MNILEEEIIMTMMTMKTTTSIAKTKTVVETTIIKYQMMIQLVMHPMMMMIAMMATPSITIDMIMTHLKAGMITQNMRNMKKIMLMNLEMVAKM